MSGPLTDPHLDLLDDARHAAAVADRSQRRLFAEAGDHEASLAGSLRAAAEAGSPVVLDTTVDRSVRGRVRALAHDHVVVADARGVAWVRLDAVTVLRSAGAAGVEGGPAGPAVTGLGDALRPLTEERDDVEVLLTGGGRVRGRVLAVGRDVLTLRGTGGDQVIHLRHAAVVLARPG